MSWDHRNIANTVHAAARYETQRCEVGYEPSPWSKRYISWVEYHRWPDGERATGRCINCGKTLAEVRVRINPKTGEPVRQASSIAREISKTRDVPRIVFTNRPPE